MDKIKEIVDGANMIINGYAFTRDGNFIRILNLNNPDKALVISNEGKVLEPGRTNVSGSVLFFTTNSMIQVLKNGIWTR